MNDKYFVHRYIYIIGILLALEVWNTCGVAAQEVILRGSTHRYSITPASRNANYTYRWSVTGGTSSALGSGSTSNPVVWDGPPGLYTVSMYPTDAGTGCAGNTQNFRVKVIDFFVRWQGVSSTVCSAYGNEERDFSVVVEFTQTIGIWSFEYQIDDHTPIKVTVNGETNKIINISGFVNRSANSAETHKIRIVSITIPDGHQFTFDGTEKDAAAHVYTVTVNPLTPPGKIEFIRDLSWNRVIYKINSI
jgi:hypothetical protein